MRKLGLWTLLLAAVALMAGLGGCSSNDSGLTGPDTGTKGAGYAGDVGEVRTIDGTDIVDTAIGAGSFTTLVAAVQAAGLEGALRGEGPFTVFAPTDDAFANLPAGFVTQLLQPRNQAKLQELLLYHVAAGETFSNQLRRVQFVPTLSEKYLWVRKLWNGTVKVNNARVIAADVDASNGVIHVIDKVLVPVGFELVPEEPTADIVQTAIAAGAFNTLVAAATAADLVGALQGEGPLTVFAPTDAAFANLPAGLVEALLLPENKAKLQDLLLYHVVAGRVLKGDLNVYQRVPTLQGSQVAIVKWFGNVWVNTSKVTTADVLATNGVIHVIDRVLIPRGFRLDTKSGSFSQESLEKLMKPVDDAELPPTEFPEAGLYGGPPLPMRGQRSARRAIPLSMPANTSWCTGKSAYQYARPSQPTGSKIAVWRITVWSPSAVTSNSSHAWPGTFISAINRSRRSGSRASTRQKSTVSPTCRRVGCARPRLMPTPPAARSINPRNCHSRLQAYQPLSPPIDRIGAKAAAGVALVPSVRESTRRVPKATPPHGRWRPADERASDQRVSANSCSS